MPRAGLNPAAVVTAGADLADEVGFTELSMGLLAERLGVRPPSLYKHTASLDALRHGISVLAKRELGHTLARATAGRSGRDAIHAIADAYRRWATDHPGRYAATIRAPAAGDEEDQQASNDVLQIFLDVLAGFGLRDARAIDAIRALRSALHGFVTLESAGGFGLAQDVDRSYGYLVDTLLAGLRADPS